MLEHDANSLESWLEQHRRKRDEAARAGLVNVSGTVSVAPGARFRRTAVEPTLALEAPQPTCIAFGGPTLNTVYATSARQWLSDAGLACSPASGGVFQSAGDVAGLPEQRFQD